VDRDVAVTLLETVVLLDVVQVMLADNAGVGHLGGDNHTLKDTSTDGDVAGERAFLIDESAVLGFRRGLEAKTAIAGVALLGVLAGGFRAQEDSALLLEGSFVLLGGHG